MRHPAVFSFPLVLALFVASCCTANGGLPAVPESPNDATTATATATAEGQRVLRACLDAHGGAAAYARLHDVNVRLDGKWAFLAPKLQPKLADVHFRGGSEERYLWTGRGGFVLGHEHRGPSGTKAVFHRLSPTMTTSVIYNGQPSSDPEARAAAALVADAYTMFLFGPDFFFRRGAALTKILAVAKVDGRACDEVLAVLRPGFGESRVDRVVLFLDQQDHVLRRVQFTLNGLESTQGADVHVDLLDHRQLAGVRFPTRFYEQIDHPAPIPAHRWRMTGFDANRGYSADDLAGPTFQGKAAPPARPLP